MPRIRRFFPVSHDINHDPEVWELTDRFGERALRVWLEILSIADRHEGILKGTISDWSRSLLRTFSKGGHRWIRRDSERLLTVLLWMSEKGWISIRDGSDASLTVVNYGEYHRSREPNRSRPGVKKIPIPPNPPNPPNLPLPGVEVATTTPTVDRQEKAESPTPDWFRDVLSKSEHFSHLADGHAKFWRTMNTRFDQYDWLGWDEELQKADVWCAANPARAPTQKGAAAFLRNWFEKAVEGGRVTRGEKKATDF